MVISTKPTLHQIIAGSHSFGFRSERVVRERPSLVDTESRALGLCD
jgi:hypothetical protein